MEEKIKAYIKKFGYGSQIPKSPINNRRTKGQCRIDDVSFAQSISFRSCYK